jgi:DNA-binding transcriptional LysR family regulator
MRHFEFLHRLGLDPNLGRVAAQMNMAQPTASKLLQEIEDIVGARLFVRNRRGMSPTREGLAMTRRAEVILADLRAAHEEFVSLQAGGTGRIRIGVFPVAVPQLLVRLVEALGQVWPGICIAVEEGDERALQRRLSGAEIDCVLGRVVSESLSPELGYVALYHEPSVIVASRSHPVLAAGAAERPALLAAADWILPHPGGGSYRMVSALLAGSQLPPPRAAIETISVFVTLEILHSRPALSVMPASVAASHAAQGRLAIVPVELAANHYPVGVIFRREQEATAPVRQVIALARELAAQR